ncbi:GBF-interacting protein 1-like isoform X1 [Trifolium pratense]|uniref:GBF-interacting protein 1-like isoform X1 n=1 Tax=Trifolium pratense TaxID=57577 RepID=UPI001E694961|nr:GBF-interacting protein 1-like isoform X1 [Trifolium pratense]
MSGAGSRDSISTGVKKTIQNIKEITGNHSDDEIYAMLKECSMDPNETAQKLLFQDTFHEVKRKKDRRKENVNNRETLESRSRPGTQGRGVRGGQGNFSPHRIVHDARSGKNSGTGKDNVTNQGTAKGVPPLPDSQETKTREKSSGASSVPAIANGPTTVASGTTNVNSSSSSTGNRDRISPSDNAFPSDSSNKGAKVVFGSESVSSTSDGLGSRPASSSAVCFSSSDPVLVPSNDSRFAGAVGAIKREVGSQRPPGELNAANTSENKSAAFETGSSFQGKSQGKSPAVAKNQVPEVSSSSTVIHGTTSGSRPSSNYNNRSQQIGGLQKAAGSNKEWKPKPTNTINQSSGPASVSESSAVSAEVTKQLPSVSKVLDSEEATSELQKKLEDLRLPQRQHVILPNHILVPDSEKNKFSFGSLGINFGVTTSYGSSSESEKSSTPLSKASQAVEETAGEQASSNQNASVTSVVGDYSDNPQPPSTTVPENFASSAEVDVSTSTIQEDNESKHGSMPSEGNEYSVVHTSPNYNLGFMSPMLETQSAQIDNSESQARDMSRLQNFVVHQPFDPNNYYAQYYRPGADSDGRLSPLASSGVTTKYNGGAAVLPTPSSQSLQLQEGAGLSSAGQTSHATQAAGMMQNSIATQQPLPVFRAPSGVHIPHYPPNYIPYGHYFSPFYVQPQAIHQYLGNGAFPQQPQASTVYPPPSTVAANGMKYPHPQYKPGTNAANSAHYVMPAAYGAYGSTPASGYNPSSGETAGNSTSNEDLGSSQFKENNVYLNGQQSEGSAMWVAAPGRDISNMPASSFYNLPPQGQHVTFAPTQAGHGNFAGVYHHPAQAVAPGTVHPLLQQSQTMAGAVDMVGPGGNVYQQQPQHAHNINWPSNY